jgi:ATP-binding cassette, subfamily B, bacterial
MSGSRTEGARLLWQEVRPVTTLVVCALGVLIIGVLATLAGPLLVQYFVDRATAGGGQRTLLLVALAYLVVALVGGSARVASGYLGVQSGWRIADSLRIKLLRRAAVDSPILEVESRPVGEVLEKVEGNADIVGRSIAESGFRLLGNMAIALGTLAVMAVEVPAAGVGISALMLAVCVALTRLGRVAVRRWQVAREQQAELFGFIGDSLAARDDLLPLGESAWATERARDDLAALYRTEGRAYIGGRAFWPLTQLFVALAFGLGFGFGLQRLIQGSISIGTLTAIYLYVDLLQKPLEEVSSQAGQMQQMMAVLAMAARLLRPDTADRPGEPPPPSLPEGPLAVTFDCVTFGYGDVPVLRDVSFRVGAGRSLGIVGRTGAGKSTIINLLCGLSVPDRGRVLIGGIDASRLAPAEFARRVTVMSQRAHVFSASVRENVTLFDDDIPEARVWEVLDRLNAAGWVRDLPQGIETQVGAGGRTLSEGELQLLAGARALIRPYSLLIVDEGTSRLDPETERSWARLLDTVMRHRTVIVVGHRQGALRGVGETMLMDEGRVVAVMSGPAAAAARQGRR